MKLTRYAQSCMLVETNGKRILVDPGMVHYDSTVLKEEWTNIDVILVTHRHPDHCNKEAIATILKRDQATLYTSSEVLEATSLPGNPVKAEEQITFDSVTITVTKAVHGYLTGMRESGNEIFENIGFIIDDGKTRIYFTSDTINFYNNYQCDIICMPFNGNGLTLGLVDGIEFFKHTNAHLVIPVHDCPPRTDMIPDLDHLKQELDKQAIPSLFLTEKETYWVE